MMFVNSLLNMVTEGAIEASTLQSLAVLSNSSRVVTPQINNKLDKLYQHN
jgi:hypothetical protein